MDTTWPHTVCMQWKSHKGRPGGWGYRTVKTILTQFLLVRLDRSPKWMHESTCPLYFPKWFVQNTPGLIHWDVVKVKHIANLRIKSQTFQFSSEAFSIGQMPFWVHLPLPTYPHKCAQTQMQSFTKLLLRWYHYPSLPLTQQLFLKGSYRTHCFLSPWGQGFISFDHQNTCAEQVYIRNQLLFFERT